MQAVACALLPHTSRAFATNSHDIFNKVRPAASPKAWGTSAQELPLRTVSHRLVAAQSSR